jgi:protein ImuB
MPVAEAMARMRLHLERHDPIADRAALEELARRCEAFSPIIGLEEGAEPECLYLDITGLAALFGSEASLASQIVGSFERRGFVVRLAVAETWGAAWALAHYGHEPLVISSGDLSVALAPLPVEALRLSANTLDTLAELGVAQINQLLVLSPSTLASRFNPELLLRLNQALGHVAETIPSHRPPPDIVVERQFEYPIDGRQAADVALAELVGHVSAELTLRQQGAVQLKCCLGCEQSNVSFVVGMFQPTADANHLLELLRLWMERLSLPGPLTALRLSVILAATLTTRQRGLFDSADDHPRLLALLIDRLAGRLGREAVARAVLVADAQPELAVRYEPLINGQKPRGAKTLPPPHRPLLLERKLIPVDAIASDGPPAMFRFEGRQHRVIAHWGPERIQTGWWRGSYLRRDYYRVETESGRRFWLFRSRNKWFLHGIFD